HRHRRSFPTRRSSDLPYMGTIGGNERAHLREDSNEGVLAEEGGFTAHVGAGDQPELSAADIVGAREISVIGDEGMALGLDHGFRSEEHTSELQSRENI